MIDREIEVSVPVAVLITISGSALIAADVADCFTNRSVGLFGVALLVGAHYVLTDRKLGRMEHRERSAFDLGRESVRSLR